MVEAHRKFLLEHLKADEVSHSGRTLWAHLKGTHDLLRDWDNPEHVCLAGLFHSVYGTKNFRHKSADFEQRPTIRALIGKDAEHLVYLFCVTDRPKVFFDSETMLNRFLYDYHSHQTVQISRQVRDELTEIEAANLIEQGAVNSKIARRLRETAIGMPARVALERYAP